MNAFQSTFEYKLIYVFRINDEAHKELLKIGEATCNTNKAPTDLIPNCHELNVAAKFRINQYTTTAGIAYDLLYTELAQKNVKIGDKAKTLAFRDHDVHDVLKRSGIKNHYFDTERKANEWFKVDLETAKKAISAVKENRTSLLSSEISEGRNPIIFRPEQVEAIKRTVKKFKTGNQMLWNAKMRFGKTLTALQVAKECRFEHILILTHRPVVSDGWYDDFGKIFYDTDYVFGSKTKGEDISHLIDTDKKFVYFASMQDLRGSESVGGKFDKNDEIFLTKWDFVVIDEAHEGTLTKLGQAVIDTITDLSDNPKILRLSGTPFNLLDKFNEDEIYTWDYVMEQRAKLEWNTAHFGDPNPYAALPELQIFTYNLDKLIPGYMDVEDSAFNFREFFRTWTGNVQKDFKPMPDGALVGDFVHKADVKKFLDLMCASNDKSNYPFSTQEYREFFRHSLWILPGVKEARALSALLKEHSVFGSGAFNIVNVAGNGDEEIDSRDALDAVRKAFGDNPDETYSITLSCGRLTTGVTVSEWTAVFMLAGTFSTSASSYMQTIFRVQSPANINGKVKERCCVFDFAPDRTLKMVAEAGKLSTKTGSTSADRIVMGEFLNFCPVIAVSGSNMQPYNVDKLLQQLKKAYTDRVVRNGFDDRHIYNDNLLKLNDIELADFESLKKIVGASKQTEKVREININDQGFTDEEYAELERIEKKPKKERTPEDLALLEEKKKKRDNAQKAMSILRGISIRIPLLIYGADVPVDREITVNNFVDLIDDASWNEFMPTGVSKDIYRKFSKYYEQDVFVAAGRQIRNMALAADELSPDDRVKKIAAQFAMFKNPDKETVLTPWRVVNMHMSDCLGGYCFYNEDFTDTLEEPRFVDRGKVTADTLANTKAQILEINSKTGLYPLYVTYSVYRKRCEAVDPKELTIEKQYQLWRQTVEENVFIICKTPMAKAITRRTLLGYRKGKINAHAFDDIIMQLKEKSEQFREKVLRGSFWNKENRQMKFDAVIGNPPYQEETVTIENSKNAQTPRTNVFHYFQLIAEQLTDRYTSLIFPAIRWIHQSGKGLKQFGKHLINSPHLEKIYLYPNSKDIFPGIDIPDGLSILLTDNQKKTAGFEYIYCDGQEKEMSQMANPGDDLLIINPKHASITQKIKEFVETYELGYLHDSILPRSLFGIESDFIEKNAYIARSYDPSLAIDYAKYIKVLTNDKSGPGGRCAWFILPKNVITENIKYISEWQVVVSSAHAGGQEGRDNQLTIIDNHSAFGRARVALKSFTSEQEAINFSKYVKSTIIRYAFLLTDEALSSLGKYVPDMRTYCNTELLNFDTDLDTQLYKLIKLNNEEIAFIESKIKPME